MIKQNIQYIDIAMATRQLRQRTEIRNLNKKTRKGCGKVTLE